MDRYISKVSSELQIFLKPVTTAEIFYAIGIYDTGPKESYNQAVQIVRRIPESRSPFQIPEQFKGLTSFEAYRKLIENFPYSDDTNVAYSRRPVSFEDVVTHTRKHIDPKTSLMSSRANCKGISTLAVVLGRHIGIPSRYTVDSENHIKFELNIDGLWIPHDNKDFDKRGSVFEPRDVFHLGELPLRYQRDQNARLSEKEEFDRLYIALMHQVSRFN